MNKYFKIAKINNQYVVLKITEYKGIKKYQEYFYSKNLGDTINFCKNKKYDLRGFII